MALKNIELITWYPYTSRREARPAYSVQPEDKILYMADYLNDSTFDQSGAQRINGANFSYGDGVNTTYVFNQEEYDPKLNYVLVFDERDESVLSRWFVVSSSRTSAKSAYQTRLILRRDLMMDFEGDLKALRFFAQRGWITNPESPFLLNKENYAADQVKTAQHDLKDETGVRWAVGFLPQNYAEEAAKTLTFETAYGDEALPGYGTYSSPEEYLAAVTGATSFEQDDDGYYEIPCVLQISLGFTAKAQPSLGSSEDLWVIRAKKGNGEPLGLNAGSGIASKVSGLRPQAILDRSYYYYYSGLAGNNDLASANGLNAVYSNRPTLTSLDGSTTGRFAAGTPGNWNGRAYTIGRLPDRSGTLDQQSNVEYYLSNTFFKKQDSADFMNDLSTDSMLSYEIGFAADELGVASTRIPSSTGNKYLTQAALSLGSFNSNGYYDSTANANYDIEIIPFDGTESSVSKTEYLISPNGQIEGHELTSLETLVYSQAYAAAGTSSVDSWSSCSFFVRTSYSTVKIRFSKRESEAWSVTIPKASDRPHLLDQPYDMFVMPVDPDFPVFKGITSGQLTSQCNVRSASVSLRIASKIATELGTAATAMGDLQILPYCPTPELIRTLGGINDATGLTLNSDGSYQYYGYTCGEGMIQSDVTSSAGDVVNTLFWCQYSQRTAYLLPYSMVRGYRRYQPIDNFRELYQSLLQPSVWSKQTSKEVKLRNATQLWRLNAHNWSASFDFSPWANGGLEGFLAITQAIPYQSYINVKPLFGKLYGGNYRDARGIIAAGDNSLPQVSDQWAQYQLLNKNYQQIFDRGIQTMDYSRRTELAQNVIGTVASTFNAVAQGVSEGGGDPISSIILGVAKGTNAAVQGTTRTILADDLRNEAIESKKDIFRMQLENVQAIPDSIAKTSAFWAVNSRAATLEIFEAPSEEVEAVSNQIDYDSFAIGADGLINGFVNPDAKFAYVRGWFEEPAGLDSLAWSSIQDEVRAGCYLPADYCEE